VATNQQRREAERRRLQRQLEERRAREAARKRTTFIASIIGTVVVIIAVVVIVVVAVNSGGDNKNKAANDASNPTGSTSTSPSASPTTSTTPPPVPTKPCAGVPKGSKATFAGLTITGATDLKHEPKATGTSTPNPKALSCQDLVIGKGPAATNGANITVQYVGLLASSGKVFQSSWGTNPAPSFGLAQGSVIEGFYEGIAGAGAVKPMHVGGRRVILMPASEAYGAQAQQGIPANSALVFIVDLQKVGS
jgi:FKBP-type peptidyl-prolyl cis-trans isomerase